MGKDERYSKGSEMASVQGPYEKWRTEQLVVWCERRSGKILHAASRWSTSASSVIVTVGYCIL